MRVINNGIPKYIMYNKDGKECKASSIGANHSANGMRMGGYISSYSEMIDNQDVINIENGIGDIRIAKLGDISEAYEILKKIVDEKKPQDFFEYCECVQETVNNYFGDYSNVSSRLDYYPSEDEIENIQDRGSISDLAHKNAATCVERAVLSHNLLKLNGFDSTLKYSGMVCNERKNEVHAYNLVKNGDKCYIFDSTQPTLRGDVVSPIICEIPKEVYNEIKKPIDGGYSVIVSHYNPLMNKDYNVIYDAGRPNIYQVVNKDVKLK